MIKRPISNRWLDFKLKQCQQLETNSTSMNSCNLNYSQSKCRKSFCELSDVTPTSKKIEANQVHIHP